MILILNIFFAGQSSAVVASRITFAMARDNAIPFSAFLYKISLGSKAPLRIIALVFLIDAGLVLIALVNTTAFAAIVGVSTVGYQVSYAIPIFLRATHSRQTFVQNYFSLGRFSIPVACVAAVWLLFTSVLFFLPSQYPITAQNMNYTCVVVAGFAAISVFYWLVSARHNFVGPKRIASDGKQNQRQQSQQQEGRALQVTETQENELVVKPQDVDVQLAK